MKKIFLSIMLALAALTCTAGTIVKSDNTVRVEQTTAKSGDTPTGYCWEDRDGKYPIYQGSKGGYFYYKVAKSGKNAGQPVKRYLSKEDREKLNQIRNNK